MAAVTEFDKYEGAGNDFIVVERGAADVPSEEAVRLCDRHFGVGADGVLLVLPPVTAAARARMVVINADGSRPEMCGNGLRCVALHLARRSGESASSFVVDTDAGPLGCQVDSEGDLGQVQLGMGRGELRGQHRVEHEGRTLVFDLVSMGNPHAILFEGGWSDTAIDQLAPKVSAAFPEGSNVEFCGVPDDGPLELVVWERGVGRTMACGTGAAATAVAAVQRGLRPSGGTIGVRLPGGTLRLGVHLPDLLVDLDGPARWVFSGRVG